MDEASKGAGLNSGEVVNCASKKVVVSGRKGGMNGDDFVAEDVLLEAEDVQMGANYSMSSIKFSKRVHKLLEDIERGLLECVDERSMGCFLPLSSCAGKYLLPDEPLNNDWLFGRVEGKQTLNVGQISVICRSLIWQIRLSRYRTCWRLKTSENSTKGEGIAISKPWNHDTSNKLEIRDHPSVVLQYPLWVSRYPPSKKTPSSKLSKKVEEAFDSWMVMERQKQRSLVKDAGLGSNTNGIRSGSTRFDVLVNLDRDKDNNGEISKKNLGPINGQSFCTDSTTVRAKLALNGRNKGKGLMGDLHIDLSVRFLSASCTIVKLGIDLPFRLVVIVNVDVAIDMGDGVVVVGGVIRDAQ
ncbi:hypothetical protein Goshw_027645 [Gossypium schwendimanii]|uniref:Uncharacterized protein n=1 Tax=Gossypium schwendimanii TaxID=34291 RepID=A0A7J9LRX6_GOSSC|nr:hypothetical protein [Gossypium schwendimanii]